MAQRPGYATRISLTRKKQLFMVPFNVSFSSFSAVVRLWPNGGDAFLCEKVTAVNLRPCYINLHYHTYCLGILRTGPSAERRNPGPTLLRPFPKCNWKGGLPTKYDAFKAKCDLFSFPVSFVYFTQSRMSRRHFAS